MLAQPIAEVPAPMTVMVSSVVCVVDMRHLFRSGEVVRSSLPVVGCTG
jgi:hypothetical protein